MGRIYLRNSLVEQVGELGLRLKAEINKHLSQGEARPDLAFRNDSESGARSGLHMAERERRPV